MLRKEGGDGHSLLCAALSSATPKTCPPHTGSLTPTSSHHSQPQAVLGLTFNWGALLGTAAVTGSIDPPAFALYAAGVAWTLAYDTVYAFQDVAHDEAAGVRSSARALRARGAERAGVAAFWCAALAGLAGAGSLAGLSPAFYGGLAVAAGHAGWQVAAWRPADAADCGAKFRSNATFGGIVFAAIVVGRVAG